MGLSWGLGHSVERNFDIVGVSVLVELDVGDLLVADNGGVVVGNIARKFGEVRCHYLYLKVIINTTATLLFN